jgi:hypothetical protein
LKPEGYSVVAVVALLLLVSVELVVLFVSVVVVSLFVSVVSVFVDESSLFTEALLVLRLSVIYHPEPLNTTPTG